MRIQILIALFFLAFVEEPEVRTRKIVKVVTQTMVNGKVVDESSEVEQIEERKKWVWLTSDTCILVLYQWVHLSQDYSPWSVHRFTKKWINMSDITIK